MAIFDSMNNIGQNYLNMYLQGDTSGRTKPIVDMKTKVVFSIKSFYATFVFMSTIGLVLRPT